MNLNDPEWLRWEHEEAQRALRALGCSMVLAAGLVTVAFTLLGGWLW